MSSDNISKLKPGGTPPPDLSSLTQAQRAAVVLALLGEEAARPVMQHLDDVALSKVASELETVSLLPRVTLVSIIVDFLNRLQATSTPLFQGRQQARSVASNIFEVRSQAGVDVVVAAADDEGALANADVWTRLAAKPADQIGAYLNGLTSNLVAIIMTQLPVGVSSGVTEFLDEDKLAESMGYMVEAQTLKPEIKNVLERMVEMEFLNREQEADAEDTGHLEGVGELLSLISGSRRENVVTFLREKHAERLENLERSVFTIEDLPVVLPRSAVPVIFRNMERDDQLKFLATLKGELEPVSEFMFANISSRLADQLKDDLASVGEFSVEQVEAIQRDFLKSIMELKRSGEVIMQSKASVEAEA